MEVNFDILTIDNEILNFPINTKLVDLHDGQTNMAAINPLTHKFIVVYSNPDQTQEILMIHLTQPENRTLLHIKNYQVFSIGYEYINNQILALSQNLVSKDYQIVQISQPTNGTTDAQIDTIISLQINGNVLMSSFHLFKSLFYLTIVTDKNVIIFDIDRNRMILQRDIPNNIIFDAIQLNTDLIN